MKPVIGITPDLYPDPKNPVLGPEFKLRANYCERIEEAGGVALIIPPTADMAAVAPLLDGWLIPGGLDIDAKHFGEELHPEAKLQNPVRFAGEKALFEALNPNVPILGVCYGCQLVNVLSGGKLDQHMPDALGHTDHEGGTLQEYSVEPDSRLGHIVQSREIKGRSYHHQAVNKVGEGLKVTARHADGTVEAIEGDQNGRFLVGVQWHPERTPELDESRRLFAAFVEAARAYRETRTR